LSDTSSPTTRSELPSIERCAKKFEYAMRPESVDVSLRYVR